MNDWKWAIILATCCSICLTIAASASADFVGVTIVTKDDPDTEFLCTQGNGDFVPGPLTVCNVYATFDDPADRLLSVGNADLQVYNGANPDVFFQHPLNFTVTAPMCSFIGFFPDLICDSFITIGYKCGPDPAGTDLSKPDAAFDAGEFNLYGHIVGGWFNASPPNGQGDAGTWPNLHVLFLQSSVAQGLSLFGDIDIFWRTAYSGDIYVEIDVPIECAAGCPDDYPCDDDDPCTEGDVCNNQVCEGAPVDCSELDDKCNYGVCNPDAGMCEEVPLPDGKPCDDGDACTENDTCIDGVCTGLPIGCDDINPCTDDDCDPDTGCTYTPNNNPCDDGEPCTDGDQCSEGRCVRGTPLDCDNGDACTVDYCDSALGCVHNPIDCDDGNACTDDSCDPDKGCEFADVDCDDNDACTKDFCDPGYGCVYEVTDCDDGDFCTDDSCDHDDSGKCTHTPTNICDDGNACTEDSCDSDFGCMNTPIDCDDEDACTEHSCDSDLGCFLSALIECFEGQVCDPATGVCVEIQDPCECVNGRVTLCHIPQGNRANARTITVGCAARDRHLAHGDACGPCEDGDG